MSTTISPDVLAFPPVPIEQLQKVRHLLSPLTNAKCSDADVRRFIRAESNKGHAASDHLEISAKRLEETVAWREKEKPDERICKLCITQPTQHYMHCIGHDLKGRPICYSCFAMGPDKEIDTNTDHMISTFESLVRLMENPESRWVSIIDFYGFTIKDAMNTKISKAFSLISGTYYPERLGESFLLDAPSIFSMLWSVISLLIDKKTQEKIKFLPFDSKLTKLREGMSKIMDAALVDWLVNEMKENRDKVKSKGKKYDVMEIYKLAVEGRLVEEGNNMDHCCWGSPALLAYYQSKPSLLLPQGSAN